MKFAAIALLFTLSFSVNAKEEMPSYSLLVKAHAPNAGGQNAYSIKRGTDSSEWGVFFNDYLIANGFPILGATYNWRFPICGSSCFWQLFVQVGGGLSTGGPVLEATWSTIPLWLLRLDFTTQFYFSRTRMILWSYPFWVGVSFPVFW